MRVSLFWKLSLSYIALALLVLITTDVWMARHVRAELLQATTTQLQTLATVLAERLPEPASSPAWASWLHWAASSGARITVIADDGRVLADSAHDPQTMDNHRDRPEIRQARRTGRGLAVRHSATLDRDLVYFAVRHDRGAGQPPLFLRLALPLAETENELQRLRRNTLLLSTGVLLFGLAVFLGISRRLARRVEQLATFSRRVAQGHFAPLDLVDSRDELDQLALALQQTARQLQQIMQSLREERDRTATILSSMQEAVAFLDTQGRIRFTNPAFRDWVQAQDVAGRPLEEVLEQPEIHRAVAEALAGRSAHTEVELFGPRRAILEATTAPVAGRGAVIVLRDITELRRLERVRRDFVANVSHELKTPLTAIVGFAETLLTGALEDPQHSRHFLEVIREHARRMARLVDDLLDLSRMEAGRLVLHWEEVSLAELLREAVEAIRVPATQAGLQVHLRCPELLVRCDPERLLQILRNLLDNALRYTPAGGRIDVTAVADLEQQRAIVTVADTGIGIPADQLDRIFERFYRLDAARARAHHGTGLGLSIARHLVEALGGRIWVESQEGSGSRFSFTVPLAASAGSTSPAR